MGNVREAASANNSGGKESKETARPEECEVPREDSDGRREEKGRHAEEAEGQHEGR